MLLTVYTRWRNLHKTRDMEVGAIGFHDRSKVKRIRVEKDNAIVNRINKTKEVLLFIHMTKRSSNNFCLFADQYSFYLLFANL